MKLSRMFLVGFDGCTVKQGHWLRKALETSPPAGVILFDKNIDGTEQNFSSPEQLKELTAELADVAAESLLIAVDQEGGRVCRLKEQAGFLRTKTAAELGRQSPEKATLPAAEAMAAELAEYGINLNLAPVADLNLNPDNPIIARYERSFGFDPDAVAAHCQAVIQGHHKYGVACCLKHFPGHGSASGDSHLGFVDISNDWKEKELEPYRIMIGQSRINRIDAVMTAHVVHYGLDPSGLPATLSPVMINTLLRNDLEFDGVIITDDLQMQAIASRYGYREAVRRAVLAGADLLIVGNNLERNPDALEQGVRAVQDLLDQGRISEERVRASLRRVELLLHF
ncbi:beta-N-acetylhexosaminidase [Candidatus Electrothrix marina]|uniref:Beta-N-acetylhexosaminidase n=1 Tax=Candidatus Electrothrix marina TaxID=1859130 RepID=A0A444J337_9BACT|nr:beta-N-acetylhexosaminidase [Candidatus Electrothrix marina]RWX51786.1 beta-N-acetylhexosaminidase [Candidatus Electrothrix marina]